jgi:hypothetical protein
VGAWWTVLVRPTAFFDRYVAPGDQAPGLVFAAAVVLVEEAIRFLLIPGAAPSIGAGPAASALFWLAIAVVLVAPAALHLVAAVQTLALILLVPDRAGVSETVQVLAYAAAPCVFAGIPHPVVRLACGAYGTLLLFVGLTVVHEASPGRALLAGLVPAALVFGYGFRGVAALEALLPDLVDALQALV